METTMDTRRDDLAGSAPLIDFGQDLPVAREDISDIDPDTDSSEQPPPVQVLTIPQHGFSFHAPPSPETTSCDYPGPLTFTPGRSLHELVESLGSPVYSNPSASPRNPGISTTPPLRSPSPETSLCDYPGTATFTPGRSIRELVESLGSPVCSNPSISPRVSTTPPLRPPGPSPFDDPTSFEDQAPNRLSSASPTFRTSDTASFIPLDLDERASPRASIDFVPGLTTFDHGPELERSFGQDCTNVIPDEEYTSLPSTPCPAPTQPAGVISRPMVPSWFNRPASPRPASPIPYAISSVRTARSPTSNTFARPYSTFTRSANTNPFRNVSPIARPSLGESTYPWNRPTTDPFNRIDRFSRTTAHTTISDVLFNFDLDPSEAAELIEDACETAKQVGVSTHDLLSRTVFLGMTDLGMTPLCLEASRVDLEGGIELVLWFIENSNPSEVEREVKKGCLMRRNGMGEQAVWNVLRGFMPDVDGKAGLAYDVEVEGLAVVPGGAAHIPSGPTQVEAEPSETISIEEDEDDDEGSLYDDVSIIDAESGFLDQADIETLKSSSDELEFNKGKSKEPNPEPEPIPSRVHRARIILPTYKESLTGPSWAYTSPSPSNRFGMASRGGVGNKVLVSEWMFEGRLWALSIGEDQLILTLRQTSALLSPDSVKVKATIRLLPVDLQWTQVKEIDRIGEDRLLPTQVPSDVLLSSPLYECEFDEKELVPGPSRVGMNSSVWKTDIRVSLFTLLELVGPENGIKIEVLVRVTEKEKVVECVDTMDVQCAASASGCGTSACVTDEPGTSIADDASDWQFVDN